MTGKHIELFLVDGVAGGLTTAEIAGWTGHVLAGPRSQLADLLRRPEAHRNGAYLLLGEDDTAVSKMACYIGRTENLAARIRSHQLNKSFWDRLVIITAKDDGFNEGHWGYLESRLVELSIQAGRSTLRNDNNPQGRKLSEAQASDMESFIGNLQIVLPVLGVNVIRTRPQPVAVAQHPEESPVFTFKIAKRGVDARAQVTGDEFTLLTGSQVVASWSGEGSAESTKRAYASYRALHQSLIDDGSIRVEGAIGRVTRDIPFSSPSTAGAIASGRSCNGRISWLWSGGNYGQWENRGLPS